ncbi:MAG: hypothetical protein ACTSQ8_21035 [Candidatus Helarchaeota archaeon]
MFDNERNLTQVFNTALEDEHSPFVLECMAEEFNYREGRTDVIMSDRNGYLIAFELKLEKWKQALYQAYRNSSFAHYSYVVVPLTTALRAAKQIHEFARRGIGLISVDESGINIEIEAKCVEPLRPWLTKTAIDYINGEDSCKRRNISQA